MRANDRLTNQITIGTQLESERPCVCLCVCEEEIVRERNTIGARLLQSTTAATTAAAAVNHLSSSLLLLSSAERERETRNVAQRKHECECVCAMAIETKAATKVGRRLVRLLFPLSCWSETQLFSQVSPSPSLSKWKEVACELQAHVSPLMQIARLMHTIQ